MERSALHAWLSEEGITTHPVDTDGYAFVDHITIGDVGMLVAQKEGRPFWVLETRFEVHYQEAGIDEDTGVQLKHHLLCTFLERAPRVRIDPVENGIAATFTRHIYPQDATRQSIMDELWAMRNHGLSVSAEVDRFLLHLAPHISADV